MAVIGSFKKQFRVPEMVIYYIRHDEKTNRAAALTYTAVEILNVKRTIEKNC